MWRSPGSGGGSGEKAGDEICVGDCGGLGTMPLLMASGR
jgi:hypothetical protein